MRPRLTLSSVLNAKCTGVRIKTCGDPTCNTCRSVSQYASSLYSEGTGWPTIVTREAWDALVARVAALEGRVATLEAENVNQQRQIVALKHDLVVEPS